MKVRHLMVSVVLAGVMAPVFAQQTGESGAAVYISRARMQDAQGRHDLAAENWRQVLLLSPRQPEALAALARYYQEQGDTANAKTYLDRLRAVQPQTAAVPETASSSDDQRLLNRASSLAQQHQYREAIDLYRKVLGEHPTSGDWAVVYYQTEAAIPSELPQAIASLRKIVSDYPANPRYRLALAKVLTYGAATRAEGLQMLGAFQGSPETMEEARIAWRDALLWDPGSAAAQESGAAYLQRYPDEELSTALKNGQAARARTASLGSPAEAEAYKALRNGDLAGAKKAFNALLSQAGQASRAHMGLGYVAMKQQDFPAAIEEFSRAKSAGLHSSELESAYTGARYWDLMQRGTHAEDAGDDSAAMDSFSRAAQLEPSRPEAKEALAGLWIRKQQPDRAMNVLADVLQSHDNSITAWQEVANAELQAGQYQQLLAQQKKMPPTVLDKLNQDPDYIAAVASAQMSLGHEEEAQRSIEQLDSMPSADEATRSKAKLRLADLMMREGRTEEAVRISMAAVREDRTSADGWQTLIRAEHEAGHDGSAVQLAENLPASIREKLMRDPGFLIEVAAAYQQQHQYEHAAEMLLAARKVASEDLQTSIPLQLRVASLDQEMGKVREATAIYRQLIREASDRTECWIGYLSALHAAGHDAEALEVTRQIPLGVRGRMRNDPGYLQVLASIYSGTGDQARALEYLRLVSGHYREQGVAAPFAVSVQYAWLQLNAGDEAGLSASLDELSKHQDLSLAQKKQIEDIWVARSIRRAEASLRTGGADRGLRILEVALQVYPNNPDLRREIGTFYIRRGQADKAYAIYEQFDWSGAVEADFAGGVAAAAASHHGKQAEAWLRLGLDEFPGSTKLLTEGAQMEQDLGDYSKAEAYWRALRSQDDTSSDPALASTRGTDGVPAQVNPAAALAQLLTPSRPATAPRVRQQSADPALVDDSSNVETLLGELSSERTRTADQSTELNFGVAQNQSNGSGVSRDALVLVPASHHVAGADSAEMADSGDGPVPSESPVYTDNGASQFAPMPAETAGDSGSLLPSSREVASLAPDGAIMGEPGSHSSLGAGAPGSAFLLTARNAQPQQPDGLSALQAKLSPYLGFGSTVYSRSGQAGFDQLDRYEFDMEGSTVLGNAARLTVITRPEFLNAGTQGSNALYGFGSGGATISITSHSAGTGASTAPANSQYVTGIGGELQLATAHMQASIGYTPASFLVHNTLGSLVISPSNAFSLHFSRQPVTETMLSYAGEQDPATGQIWGGVVATGGGIKLSHGDAQSGFYLTTDYNKLTGRNVQENISLSGSMGGYWKVFHNDQGALTAGLNMTGMHYERNLQYFTLGQGGYFSPEAYMLLNAPLTWQGNPMKNFIYTISGSLGTQTYQQGTITPGSFLTTVNTQPGASANYDFSARGSYRITPVWYVEGWLSANNAYDYQQKTAGFSLRYMAHPHPAAEETGPYGIFEPKQIRPLLIP